MPDQKSVPFEAGDRGEQVLWEALGDLPQGEPSPELRKGFYQMLEQASRPGPLARLRDWLGLGSNMGWLTVAAALVLGVGLSQALLQRAPGAPGPAPGDDRLAALEANVAMLNREVILGRLSDDSAALRLQGVVQASSLAGEDPELARALLATAARDRSSSVRSAAIDALAPQLGNEAVSAELLQLLEQADSPIVQLALVDLVLRYGSEEQRAQLLKLAEQDRLHPDLIQHVHKTLGVHNA
jgi:hypothetical protein